MSAENVGCQSVPAVIGEAECFIGRLKRHDADNRSECFFSHYQHIGGGVGQDGRCEVPAFIQIAAGEPIAAQQQAIGAESLQALVEGGRVEVVFTHLNHSNPALDPAGPERAAARTGR